METYLVGGAVRDALLGLPVKDRDWVVVGASPESMIEQGYRPVGRDFPVFLHPTNHEEYALARTERKTAPGYQGFVFNTDPSVTLEDDLKRRDLTVNAMAQTLSGELVDPYNGKADLDKRLLRHVSDAFAEDPVRVLRVARFLARLAPLGFTIADDTLTLMRALVSNGEVENLVPERVWQELQQALTAPSPRHFVEALRACGALAVVVPEVDQLFGVPQPAEHHPEIDSGEHTLMVLDQATALSNSAEIRFAALCHDLGKATTPAALLPSHHGHEQRGAELVETLCKRLRAPRRFRDLAELTARYHLHCHRAMELKASTIASLLKSLDVVRKPERFEQFLVACEADARGRGGPGTVGTQTYPQADHLRACAKAFRDVDAQGIARACADKSRIPDALHEARVAAIRMLSAGEDR